MFLCSVFKLIMKSQMIKVSLSMDGATFPPPLPGSDVWYICSWFGINKPQSNSFLTRKASVLRFCFFSFKSSRVKKHLMKEPVIRDLNLDYIMGTSAAVIYSPTTVQQQQQQLRWRSNNNKINVLLHRPVAGNHGPRSRKLTHQLEFIRCS